MAEMKQPTSLRVRLLVFLLAAIALAAGVQGVMAYRSALAEADALFDYHMQQTAFALRAGLPPGAQGLGSATAPEDENHEFIVQVWTNEGLRIFESAVGAALPQLAVLGFTNVQARGATYRVFSLQTHSQVIQVAQDMAVRRGMARALALRSLVPLAVMAPLLALAVWWAVSRLLAPVERVRGQLARRQADDLSPVSDAELPDEVQPLVRELNLLFARVQNAFEAQQHFVADAAHELRSPLAALKLQVQGLRRAPDAEARTRAGARLAAGIDRATRLVEQLLVLARQEASAAAGAPTAAVDLSEVVRLALADAAPAAQARGIDLGLVAEGGSPVPAVAGQAEALRILVRNLLDNAVKYTPEGGTVDVALRAHAAGVEFSVEDSGPGIPEAERARVLDRFYRAAQAAPGAAGSGLGLAIVQSIARLHGAALVLEPSPRLRGLRVALTFPLAPDKGAAA
jgi:two-component system OmpR family sensor kinase